MKDLTALQFSHALVHTARMALTMKKDKVLLVNLSGQGDKGIDTVAKLSGIDL